LCTTYPQSLNINKPCITIAHTSVYKRIPVANRLPLSPETVKSKATITDMRFSQKAHTFARSKSGDQIAKSIPFALRD
jgi:hypothetical protein